MEGCGCGTFVFRTLLHGVGEVGVGYSRGIDVTCHERFATPDAVTGFERARRDLTAGVSHDRRTPLTAALALIEAVADGVIDPETEARYLRSSRKELVNLGRLIDDLFEFVQIDADALRVDMVPASLRDLISDTFASFRPQAERRGIRLAGEVSSEVDPVLMDLPRLQRVLHNLVSNALRHTPADGTLALRAAPYGDEVRAEVRDTGVGIAPEDLPRVFERSFRAEGSRTRPEEDGAPGAGLGLAIARGLIEAHGARWTSRATRDGARASASRFAALD